MEAIRRDPRFKNGNYHRDDFREKGLDGLAFGRIARTYIIFIFLIPIGIKKFG